MPAHLGSILKSAWKQSWERYGSYTLWATFIETLLFFVLSEKQRQQVHLDYWILFVPIALFALVFIKNAGKTEAEFKFEGGLKPAFDIKFIPQELNPNGTVFCDVMVYNLTNNKTAREIHVEVIEFEDSPDDMPQIRPTMPLELTIYQAVFPYTPLTINPGSELKFDGFEAELKHYSEIENPKKAGVFMFAHIKQQGEFKCLIFEIGRDYIWKIKVTAEDLAPTTTRFKLRFEHKNGKWFFSGTKF